MTFEEWFKKVDEEVQGIVGLSVYDLPDMLYHDMYDNGETAEYVARAALLNAGFPEDLL